MSLEKMTSTQENEKGQRKPRQLVFVMVDTQRWDMVGCYGNKDMHTPGIDGLAARGLLFEKAYSCQPVCGPARSAIFTGFFPHSNGSWGNSMPLGANVRTVGRRLQDAGVQTAYIGKYHLDGGDYFGLGKSDGDWDPETWYDMRNYLEELGSDEERYRSRQTGIMLKEEVKPEETFCYRMTERAIAYMQAHQNEDYLLVVSYDEPHGPSLCPEPYASMYKDYCFPKGPAIWDDLKDKPDYQRVWSNGHEHDDKDSLEIRARFLLGCNSYVDSQIDRLHKAIQELAGDAMIIYTSDHGDFMHGHSLSAKGPAIYEEITHVPLIIVDPEHPEPRRTQQLASHIDMTPTMLAHFGVKQPEQIEGRPLQALVADASATVNEEIFMEFGRYEIDHDGFGGFQPLRAIYDGRYKLSINLLSGDELYDMQEDPGEVKNLIEAEETAEIRNDLHDRLLAWMDRTRDPFRGYYWENRPWRKDAPAPSWDNHYMTRQRVDSAYEARQLDYSTGLEIIEATRFKTGRYPVEYQDYLKQLQTEEDAKLSQD